MKTPLLLAVALTATAASAGPTVEGSIGKTSFSRAEFGATLSGPLLRDDWDTNALAVELGGSYPVNAWLDGYGGLSVLGTDQFERTDVITVFSDGKLQQHHVESNSRQIGVSVGLDLHTPQTDAGFSVGARAGYSLWQQRLNQIKTLTVNEVTSDTTALGTSVETSSTQLISTPVLGVYAEYQYDNHNSVRLFVNQSSTDFDDKDLYPLADQGARMEQDMRTVGLMFRHRY